MTVIVLPNDEYRLLAKEVVLRLDPAGLGMLVSLCGFPVHTLTSLTRWPEMAEEVLRRAESDLWLGELLQTVIDTPQQGKPLVTACTRALAAWRDSEKRAARYAPRDRKSALVLFNDAPFVDRAVHRSHVHGLVLGKGRRVMIVRGETATGKSHMGLFVRHLIESDPQVRMAPIRLHEIGGEQIGPIDLMAEIASAMGFSTEGTQWDALAQEARQAEKLSRWFAAQTPVLLKRQETWLLVIDGLNDPRVSTGALELVDRLTIAGSRGDLVNTSVLLLALPTPTPAQVDGDVLDLMLTPLTENDFRTHVVELAQVLGRDLQAPGAAVVTDFLLKGLTFPLDHEGMAVAGKRLRQLPDLIETD